MEKEKSILGKSDVYMETVKKQSINRRNPLKPSSQQQHNKLSQIRQDRRYAAKKEGALVKKIELKHHVNFFPAGYEKIFLGFYLLILPYLAGVLFLFFYVAGSNADPFASLYEKPNYLLSWCIGYEILAVITLLYIILNAMLTSLKMRRSVAPGAAFRRP